MYVVLQNFTATVVKIASDFANLYPALNAPHILVWIRKAS